MTGQRSVVECPCLSKGLAHAALQLAEVVLGVGTTAFLINGDSLARRPGGLVQLAYSSVACFLFLRVIGARGAPFRIVEVKVLTLGLRLESKPSQIIR